MKHDSIRYFYESKIIRRGGRRDFNKRKNFLFSIENYLPWYFILKLLIVYNVEEINEQTCNKKERKKKRKKESVNLTFLQLIISMTSLNIQNKKYVVREI